MSKSNQNLGNYVSSHRVS